MTTDLYWTLRGDLSFGADGDLRDTSFDALRSVWQEIRTRVQGHLGDWRIYPTLGSNLDDLVGWPNNKTTAENGKNRIIAALTRNNFLSSKSIKVRYVPWPDSSILYFIDLLVSLDSNVKTSYLGMKVLYNTIEGKASLL